MRLLVGSSTALWDFLIGRAGLNNARVQNEHKQ
jgi:hypothetical protein